MIMHTAGEIYFTPLVYSKFEITKRMFVMSLWAIYW